MKVGGCGGKTKGSFLQLPFHHQLPIITFQGRVLPTCPPPRLVYQSPCPSPRLVYHSPQSSPGEASRYCLPRQSCSAPHPTPPLPPPRASLVPGLDGLQVHQALPLAARQQAQREQGGGQGRRSPATAIHSLVTGHKGRSVLRCTGSSGPLLLVTTITRTFKHAVLNTMGGGESGGLLD